MGDSQQRRKKLNIFLILLLLLALILLVGIAVVRHYRASDAISPDNYILQPESEPAPAASAAPTPSAQPSAAPARAEADTAAQPEEYEPALPPAGGQSATLTLYRYNTSEEAQFDVYNMFPGDSERKDFVIEVSHRGSVTVHFAAEIRPSPAGAAVLAKGLSAKIVREPGSVCMYEGSLADLPASLPYELPGTGQDSCDTLTYKVSVFLPTSAGNEYQSKTLIADLRWWVEESGGDASSWIIDPATGRPRLAKTLLSRAATGDASALGFMVLVLVGSLAALAVLLKMRKRKDVQHNAKA